MKIVHPEIENYMVAHSSAEEALLQKLNRETHAKVLRPRMLSGHLQGKLLEMISYMIQPRYILEIGTYTGYSAICLSRGLQKGGKLYTIDHNAELEDFTRAFFEQASLIDVIEYYIGEALDVLPRLEQVFDLVFIDADKENYIAYYNIAMDKLRSGGFILADNVLWDGKVLGEPSAADVDALAIKQFNEYVQNDHRTENLLLPFRDGISLIRKI